jgi:hypothetical protein
MHRISIELQFDFLSARGESSLEVFRQPREGAYSLCEKKTIAVRHRRLLE